MGCYFSTLVEFTRGRFSGLLLMMTYMCRRCPLSELGLHFIDTCRVQLLGQVRRGKFCFIPYTAIVYFFARSLMIDFITIISLCDYVCVLKSDVQSQAVTVDKSLSVEQCHIHASGVLSFTSEIKSK